MLNQAHNFSYRTRSFKYMLFNRVKQQTASLYDTSQSVRSCMTWTTSTISSLTGRAVLLIACSDDSLPVRLRSGFGAVCVCVCVFSTTWTQKRVIITGAHERQQSFRSYSPPGVRCRSQGLGTAQTQSFFNHVEHP